MSSATFNVKILTPNSSLMLEDVESLFVMTDNGEINILPYHVEYLANVEISILTIIKNNEETHYAVGGGAIHFINETNLANIILNSFIKVEDIDIEKANKAKEDALLALKSASSIEEHKNAELSLKTAIIEVLAKNQYKK